MQPPLWGAAGCLLVLVAARLLQQFPIPLPPCGFRTLTGIPCPLCGSTRALMAWSHFKLTEAFHLNPLVALAPVVVGAWLGLAALDRYSGRTWLEKAQGQLRRKPWALALVGAAVANWIYLMLFLPVK